ncbi:SRPBCC domain-containing protein [Uliginosibacterium aquaticum]|uniref:SRPBCC domain-containing protein n=1 Tax=Uliginosibacterium aquaticum TaxID=2731212 RepID=A0ABX2IIA2_9RHOO|nr:SRPBCC domain-containing protein [Uliginosibacterium aquaticum]NSL56551.1 SRPBCC domain-containing protein [Uliginosibacterium aquaticum]
MNTFTNQRVLPAEAAAIFAAIRNPERLARWWGPAGFSNRFEIFEFVPGGRWVFDMIGPDGTVYPNESTFERIVADGEVVIRHSCAPLFTLSITLTPAPGGTLLRWEQRFDDPALAEALRPIIEPANEENLDRLTHELASTLHS